MEASTLTTDLLPASTWDPANAPALREQLARDGFLFFRGLLPVELVAQARQLIADDLAADGFISEESAASPSSPLFITSPPDVSPRLLDRLDLQRDPSLASVLEHPSLRQIMSLLLSASSLAAVKTHPYKWLRAVGPGLYTGPHVDATYFPPTTYPKLLTAWIPLSPLTTTLGSLMIAPELSAAPLQLAEGGDGTKAGWISDGKAELEQARWLSADMGLGDVVVIDPSRCLHMSSRNCAEPKQWRISCDTRWWI